LAPDNDSLDGDGAVVVSPEGTPVAETAAPVPDRHASAEAAPDGGPERAAGENVTGIDTRLAEIAASLEQLAGSAQRYHARAEQREAVIDHFSSEVERLRRGERRGLMRPLLVEICRLRADLLRQADDLPDDFDAKRARLLLRSYADTVELVLEDNGITTYAPGEGDAYDPRMHRQAGTAPAADASAIGSIASVRRDGYLDIDAGTPVAPAEVVVFVRVPAPDPSAPVPGDASVPGQNERNDQ